MKAERAEKDGRERRVNREKMADKNAENKIEEESELEESDEDFNDGAFDRVEEE
jgi:hypothetical protein